MLIHMAEYCDTPESKDRSNREYKACLREGAIPRLLDHEYRGEHRGDLGGPVLHTRCSQLPNQPLEKSEPVMNLSCPSCVYIDTFFRAGVLTVHVEEPGT